MSLQREIGFSPFFPDWERLCVWVWRRWRRRRRAKQCSAQAASSDQSHLSSALPEMLLSAFSPSHATSTHPHSCFELFRFLQVFSPAFHLVWPRFSIRQQNCDLGGSLARVWSGRDVSGCAGVIGLRSDVVEKRDWARFNKGHFCNVGVRQVDTMSAQWGGQVAKMKASYVGRPRFKACPNQMSHLSNELNLLSKTKITSYVELSWLGIFVGDIITIFWQVRSHIFQIHLGCISGLDSRHTITYA